MNIKKLNRIHLETIGEIMRSLVTDLENDITNNKDILSILNKALIISNELCLEDFKNWIECEINGYDSTENLSLEYADGSTIKKNASTLRTLSGNCSFNLTVSATTKLRSINAAGYLIYVDKNGNTQTVYSTVQTSIYVNN